MFCGGFGGSGLLVGVGKDGCGGSGLEEGDVGLGLDGIVVCELDGVGPGVIGVGIGCGSDVIGSVGEDEISVLIWFWSPTFDGGNGGEETELGAIVGDGCMSDRVGIKETWGKEVSGVAGIGKVWEDLIRLANGKRVSTNLTCRET